MTAKEVQALLSDDGAMVLFAVAEKETYVFALTRDNFDWKPIPLGAEALSQKVAAFRRGLDISRATDASDKSACSTSRAPTSSTRRCRRRSSRW
jgi:hypothetical protein